MPTRERLVWVDVAKGLAIVMVVCMHTNGIFLYRQSPLAQPSTWWVLNIINSACRVCIPLFFMLSGAVILGVPERSTLGGAYVRRICRTLIPLLVWSLIYLAVTRLVARRLPTVTDLVGIAAGKAHYHLWFLYSITGMYIISPMLNAYVCATGEKGSRILGILWLTVVGTDWSVRQGFQFSVESNFTRVLPVFTGYVLLGYAMRNLSVTRNMKIISATVYLGGLVACAVLARTVNSTANQFEGRFGEYINPIVMAMSVATFLMLRPSESSLPECETRGVSKFLTRLGWASFGIYLSHVLVLEFAVRFAHKENWLGLRMLPVIAVVPILTILAITFAWGFTAVFAKIPVVRRLVV